MRKRRWTECGRADESASKRDAGTGANRLPPRRGELHEQVMRMLPVCYGQSLVRLIAMGSRADCPSVIACAISGIPDKKRSDRPQLARAIARRYRKGHDSATLRICGSTVARSRQDMFTSRK